eukprot:68479_1
MTNILETITTYTLLMIIAVVLTPLMIYYMILYWSHHCETVIHKRHPQLVLLFCLFLLLNMLGDKGLFMIAIIITPTLNDSYQHPIYLASDFMYYICGPCMFSLFTIRSWLLLYDLNWITLTNYENKWAHWINDTENTKSMIHLKRNFYINHRHNFGHPKWILFKLFVPITILTTVTLFIAYYVGSRNSLHYFVFLLYTLTMIVLVTIIYCKLPEHQIEIFKLKIELFASLKIGISFIAFFVVYVILKIAIFTPDTFWLIMSYQYICVIHYIGAFYVAIVWILRESGLFDLHKRLSVAHQLERHSDSPTKDRMVPRPLLSLTTVLRNKLSFDLFMEHLHREISMESLLCVVEMWQFKECMEKEYQHLEFLQSISMNTLVTTFEGFRLPQSDDMPQSQIVYHESRSMNHKAILLMQKYIVEYAILEVNISGEAREQLMESMDSIQHDEWSLQQLYDTFDEVILELLHVLRDSLTRFTHTEEHDKLLDIDFD